MAQRTIHALFADLIAKKLELKDKNRFILGSILPDAFTNPSNRKIAHFTQYRQDDNSLYFGFNVFFNRFQKKIMTDDLYLGYYAHLVEDAFYRRYLYYEKNFMEKLERYQLNYLHDDYRILNSYIVEKYGLPDKIDVPSDFDEESIHSVTEFNVQQMIDGYQKDLIEKHYEKTRYLTEEMLDEFIDEYSNLLFDELSSIRKGQSVINELDYRWENKK